MLDLEAEGVRVHLVRGGGVAEYLGGVLPCGRVEDGDFYQQTT